jgi:aminoglycoside phosphotransferase (APT) family kinase protein
MLGPPSDAELHEALESALAEAGCALARLIRRRPSEYRTSFPLEELELTLEDGAELRLVCKQLEWDALTAEARLAKPEFLHDPLREPAVYATLLAPAALGAPRYYGSFVDPEAGRHLLFIEWVEGRELYQVGERELWEAAAAWLGTMHQSLAEPLDRRQDARLLDHDAAYYRRWIDRARDFAGAPGQPPSRRRSIESLAPLYEAASEELLALPRTIVHGEFYASNVLVAGDPAHPRIAPVDWELAALAPGVIDLAALVSGNWSDEDRGAIAAAYRTTAGPFSPPPRELDLARLYLAVQWLGWAEPSWTPPPGQRQDWLGQALSLAEELGL